MKHTKILVLALLVALLACLALSANADCAHPYDKWTKLDTKDPSCTTDGTITWQCTACGHIWYENIPNLGGHQRSGYYVVAKAGQPCQGDLMVEVCARHTALGGKCTHIFSDNQYTTKPSAPHDFVEVSAELKAGCTTAGHKALKKCTYCGAVDPNNDGSMTKPTGHNFGAAPLKPGKPATCASDGYALQPCANNCGAENKIILPKTSYHTEKDGTPKNGFGENDIYDMVYAPAKMPTCTEPGCKAIYKCSTCLAVDPNHNGATIPATGHKMVVDQSMTKLPTCTTKGQSVLYCTNSWDFGSGTIKCPHTQLITSPALGHSATWIPREAVAGGNTVWELKCANCNTVLATKLVGKGEKAPSGTVNTGVVADTKSYEASNKGVSKVAKTNTTKKTTTKKTTTAKTTTTKAATTKAATTTTAAAATEVKAEGTKLVAGINNLEDKAVVVVKDGKATLVYAEADVIVKIGETALEANVPVDVAADATATVAAADAAATK